MRKALPRKTNDKKKCLEPEGVAENHNDDHRNNTDPEDADDDDLDVVFVTDGAHEETGDVGACGTEDVASPDLTVGKFQSELHLWHDVSDAELEEEGGEEGDPAAVGGTHVGMGGAVKIDHIGTV